VQRLLAPGGSGEKLPFARRPWCPPSSAGLSTNGRSSPARCPLLNVKRRLGLTRSGAIASGWRLSDSVRNVASVSARNPHSRARAPDRRLAQSGRGSSICRRWAARRRSLTPGPESYHERQGQSDRPGCRSRRWRRLSYLWLQTSFVRFWCLSWGDFRPHPYESRVGCLHYLKRISPASHTHLSSGHSASS
jgi:hypothetical protein